MSSKQILNHYAVAECNDGESQGFDYKYNVILKENYVWVGNRNEGFQQMNYNTVIDCMFDLKRVITKQEFDSMPEREKL
jgi:hypothetical protein